MDIFLIILGSLFILAGLIGCIVPAAPGPPLSFVGLLLLELSSAKPYSFTEMAIWFTVVLVVTLLDYYVPIWGTKKYGGSKYGTWGSVIGVFVGLFFMPVGIIIGPFLGAFIGELIYGQTQDKAFKAGLGSFVGFLFGTLLKLIVSTWIAFTFFKESINFIF